MTIRMISMKAHRYGGRQLKVGDEFDAVGRSDVRLLRALGRAEVTAAVVPAVEAPPAAAPAAFGRSRPRATTTPERAASTPAPPPVPVPAPAPVVQPAALDVPAAPAPAASKDAAADDDADKPKRLYKRRDLTAEGSD